MTTCTNKGIKNEVRANLKKNGYRAINTQHSFSTAAQNASVIDINGQMFPFYEVLDPNRITIIDNWATWCKPCIAEAPFINRFDSIFYKEVQFIYVSYDDDKSAWENFVTTQGENTTRHYWLKNGFDSPFAKAFGVTSIPRYIAIDGSQLVVLDPAMDRPSKVLLFEAQIKSHLK